MARQYTGTAGRIENAQVGVFLAYATPAGRTFLIDRGCTCPRPGPTTGPLRGSGYPARRGVRDQAAAGERMLARALDAGVPAAWVAGDEVYGQYSKLRVMLEERGVGYVLAVPVNQHVHTRLNGPTGGQLVELRADALAAQLPAQAWKKISAGLGAKGPRMYHWARAAVRPLETTGQDYWLLARRSLSDPSDLAYYLCHGPADTPLRELVRVAGAAGRSRSPSRAPRVRSAWTTTRSAATTPGTGTSPWPCSPTPTSPSPAPAPQRGAHARGDAPGADGPDLADLVALSVHEIRRLLTQLIWRPAADLQAVLDWSRWRRRHQARARRCHYQARNAIP